MVELYRIRGIGPSVALPSALQNFHSHSSGPPWSLWTSRTLWSLCYAVLGSHRRCRATPGLSADDPTAVFEIPNEDGYSPMYLKLFIKIESYKKL